jgi:hypothetical protein
MKALSVRQPWAWLICVGYKDIENRDWSDNFRGRIYIQAGMKIDVHANSNSERSMLDKLTPQQRDEYRNARFHRGAIIGEVDIVDCVKESNSPWFTGRYGFVLANPSLYKEPIPCKGKLRFFKLDI